MSDEAQEAAESNGGVIFDEVFIDGSEYKVRKEVSDEIIQLRMAGVTAILERIKTICPTEDDTIIVYTPASVGQEFLIQVGDLTKAQFPANRVAVLPEGLDMHTQEGLGEFIEKGMNLATAVERQDGHEAHKLALEYIDSLSGREEKPDGD